MNNTELITFSIGLLILLVAGLASASATTISLADATVEPGDVITLPIMISDMTDYGTGTIEIEYDPAVAHVTAVTGGSMSQIAALNMDNTIGLAQISALNLQGVSGDIIFANVIFTATGSGSTQLNLDVTILGDISYNEIPVTIRNGSIEVATGSIPGDVNNDQQLTTDDVAIILEMATCGEYLQIADVNGDCIVTSLDALMIL